MIAATYARKSADQIGARSEAVAEPPKENMMGKRTSSAKMLNKEAKGNGSSVDQQILATLQEILSSLRAIESHLPVDTGTMEQRLDDILRELHRHRPARD